MMKHLGFLTGLALGCAGALHAAEVPTFADFDSDKDGTLDEQEYQAAKSALYPRKDDASETRYTVLLLEGGANGTRSVDELEKMVGSDTRPCDPEQVLFVRADLQGVPLALCAPGGKGLSFSAQDNRETDVSSLNLDGGLGVRLPIDGRSDGANFGMIAFLEGHDLKYRSGEGDDEGQLRAGIQAEIDTSIRTGQTGTYLKFTVAPYVMTDANFDAEGYGITASVVPSIPDWRLNTRMAEQKYWFTAGLTFDYVDVRTGGVSGLKDGTEYLWAEAQLGYAFIEPRQEDPNRNGYKLGLLGRYSKDLINDEDYSHLSATWNIFLNPEKTTSLQLEYKRGETRQSPKFQDVASVGLALSF